MALTELEIATIEAVCRLGGNKQAAAELGVPLQTVKNRLTVIYRKTDARSLGQAIYRLWYIQRWAFDDLKAKVAALADADVPEPWMVLVIVTGLIDKAQAYTAEAEVRDAVQERQAAPVHVREASEDRGPLGP